MIIKIKTKQEKKNEPFIYVFMCFVIVMIMKQAPYMSAALKRFLPKMVYESFLFTNIIIYYIQMTDSIMGF